MSDQLGSDFRDLDVWKKCRDIRIMIWKLCKKFPTEEKFRLADQMIRASRSSTANTCPVKQLEVKVYYTYVLQSMKDMEFYVGFTKNLKLRFEQHNKGLVESTKHRGPFRLIYYEAYLHESDATKREKYLKSYQACPVEP